MMMTDPIFMEHLSIMCALLGILALSCRLRVVSALAAVVGIFLLFLHTHMNGRCAGQCQCNYRRKPVTMEPLQADEEEMAGDAPVPEETPPQESIVPVPTPTKDSGKNGQAVPLPEPEPQDEEAYALGLVVSDHSSGSSYARYVRPKVNPTQMESPVAQEVRGRDRLKRLVPTSFTYGGYRSTTGQTSSFAFN